MLVFQVSVEGETNGGRLRRIGRQIQDGIVFFDVVCAPHTLLTGISKPGKIFELVSAPRQGDMMVSQYPIGHDDIVQRMAIGVAVRIGVIFEFLNVGGSKRNRRTIVCSSFIAQESIFTGIDELRNTGRVLYADIPVIREGRTTVLPSFGSLHWRPPHHKEPPQRHLSAR